MTTLPLGQVMKGWGYEKIWATNDRYCGKILHFNKDARFSMHFHAQKDESWYVMSGRFLLRYIDTKNANIKEIELKEKDSWRNPPLLPHQLICIETGDIMEVSTPDSVEDNYRVFPGDSQKSFK
jgi:mannose-6-phosphate isomerase-like protein (cupin superfamily)